jgi:hypothetical protein
MNKQLSIDFNLEEFLWIPNYENLYQVSNQGRIKSFKHNKKGRILKTSQSAQGYAVVQLYSANKKERLFGVHRLVALTFLKNPYEYPMVNHKDNDKSNNNVDNLEWTDNRQNVLHAQKFRNLRYL